MRRLTLFACLLALPACSFIDDFSKFHTDAGPLDAAAVDAPSVDLAGDAPPPGDLGHPLTLDEFIAMFTPLACAHALYCEGKLGLGVLTEVYCHPELTRAFLGNGGSAGLPISDVVFDPVAAQQCLDDLAAMAAAGMDCSVSNAAPYPPSCDRAVHGARPDGAHCAARAQCASGRCDTTDSCGGTCLPLGGLSAPCTGNEQCQTSLRCRGHNCGPIGAMHDPCSRSDECGASLWCSSTANTCEPLPDSGGACEIDLGGDPCRGVLVCTGMFGARTCLDGAIAGVACDGDHPCQPGLRCSDTVHVCKTISAPLASCVSGENCPIFFVCTSGRCNPQPLLGDACDPLSPCIQGACTASTCTLLPNGTPCTMSSDPCAGHCDSTMGQCVAAFASGTTCSVDQECAPGSACLMGATTLQCTACMP